MLFHWAGLIRFFCISEQTRYSFDGIIALPGPWVQLLERDSQTPDIWNTQSYARKKQTWTKVICLLHDMHFNLSPVEKMAAILQTTFLNAFSWMKSFVFRFKISLKLVPKGPIDNQSALVQVMAWRRTGDKPLSEPVLSQIRNAYLLH